jgi:hypothetical protein
MDYYLQQQIDTIRYYADQQIADVNRRAADEIRILVERHNAQMQSEIDRAMQGWT